MFWFRSFTLGLLGACCLLLAMRPQTAVMLAGPVPSVVVMPAHETHACGGAHAVPSGPEVTVVDVAPNIPGALLSRMIVLAANERIVSIDDVPVRDAVAALAETELRGRQYLDLVVANDAGTTRRILVLAR